MERPDANANAAEPATRSTRGLRVGFHTLGCRSNHADTVDLQAALLEQGVTPTQSDTGVDVFVLNTCTVTNEADTEALRILRRIRRRSPAARIVVTGCLAEVAATELQPLADVVIGPGRKQEVLSAITGDTSGRNESSPPRSDLVVLGKRRIKRRSDRRSISLGEPLSAAMSGPAAALGEVHNRARYHLRVQEGCDNACTFCIIPQTRGRLSSRPLELVLDDARRLTELGFAEIVLTGTHLGGYGEDLGLSLLDLLRALRDDSPVRRIRLSSIDPNDVTPQLIDLLASSEVFCPHLHICMQSFDDGLLKRMNRRYRLKEALELVQYTAATIAGVCLGTDLISGFPGETREDFERVLERFASSPFAYVHSFPYSERAETPAVRLPDSVPLAERKRRSARVRAVGDRHWSSYLRGLTGKKLEILVETFDDIYLYGTSREYASLKVPVSLLGAQQANLPEPQACKGKTFSVTARSYDARDERLLCD